MEAISVEHRTFLIPAARQRLDCTVTISSHRVLQAMKLDTVESGEAGLGAGQRKQKVDLDSRLRDQEEELDDLASQVMVSKIHT